MFFFSILIDYGKAYTFFDVIIWLIFELMKLLKDIEFQDDHGFDGVDSFLDEMNDTVLMAKV